MSQRASFILLVVTVVAGAWLLGSCEQGGEGAAADSEKRSAAGWVAEALASEEAGAALEAAARYRGYERRFGGDQLLSNLLGHRVPTVRKNAALAIGYLGIACDARALRRAVDDSEWEVRRAALRTLAALFPEQAKFSALMSLKDANWQVRAEAVEALSRIGAPSDAAKLIPLADDRDEFVRYEAFKSLELMLDRFGDEMDPKLAAALRETLERKPQ